MVATFILNPVMGAGAAAGKSPPTATIPTRNFSIWSSSDSTLAEFESAFALPTTGKLLPPTICHAATMLADCGEKRFPFDLTAVAAPTTASGRDRPPMTSKGPRTTLFSNLTITSPPDAKFIANTAFPSLGVSTMDRLTVTMTVASLCGGGGLSSGLRGLRV